MRSDVISNLTDALAVNPKKYRCVCFVDGGATEQFGYIIEESSGRP